MACDTGEPPAITNADVRADAADALADTAERETLADVPAAPASPSDELFDPDRFPTFELELDEAALAILSSTTTDAKAWATGRFRYGDEVVENVSIRRKGSSTYRVLPQKAALKIRFDKGSGHTGRRFHGLTDLTLNNSLGDGSFLAERLAYYTHRQLGLPASRANSAQLFINGEPYGVYLNLETVDEDLIERIFNQGAGRRTLYEVSTGNWTLDAKRIAFEETVGNGDTRADPDLEALFAAVSAARGDRLLADVADVLDVDAWLGHCAAEALTGHHDGYAYGIWGSHNYHMTAGPDGRFALLPWSTDLTFSNNNGIPDASRPGFAQFLDNPLSPPADASRTLLQRCQEDAAPNGCWARYKDKVADVARSFEALDLRSVAERWHQQIDAAVRADPKKEIDVIGYEGEIARLFEWIDRRPGIVRAQLGLASP